MNELKTYLPRNQRLGCSVTDPIMFLMVHEVEERVPIIDDKGNTVSFQLKSVEKSCSQTLGKINPELFDLAVMLENGVKLETVNMITPKTIALAEIQSAVNKIGSLEDFAKKVDKHTEEFNALFNGPQNQDLNTEN